MKRANEKQVITNIARYLIEGTRCNMTITANTLTREIVRKPRNAKPFFVAETDCWAGDILRAV